jgi:hypothetical protein
VWVAAGLALVAVAAVAAVHTRLTRPFWYDEVWRPHFVGEGAGTFWTELADANVPSALGWVGLTRLVGEVFGWHAAALRAPSVLALPLLAVATYLLARRFTGVMPAAVAGLAIAASGTVVDLGTQLKPYTIEALAAVGIVALWTTGTASARAGFVRRCAAGLLALFSVPAVFVLVPLAAADVVLARGLRRRLRAAALAAPALAVAGLHSLLFVAHQSAQRGGRFWDTHFIAGRDAGDALRFIGAQLLAICSGAPPGVDGPDPNLVHPLTDGTALSTWVMAPAVGLALVAGVVRLSRRPAATAGVGGPDGRLLLAALVGAEVLQLAASAFRYWPFGPVRTNLFVVPLIVVVAAVGADTLARRALPRRPGAPVTAAVLVVVVAVLGVIAAVPVASASALPPLRDGQDHLRPVELLVDATTVTRRLYRPGDLVVVGGRLARPGWLYSMELSDDGPFLSGGSGDGELAAGSGNGPPPRERDLPRVPRDATVFLRAIGEGGAARAVTARPEAPGQVVLFVLAYDRRGTQRELDAMRAADWCEDRQWGFELTGTLHLLTRC